MRKIFLTLGLICLFVFICCKKNLPTSPDLSDAQSLTINYFTATPPQISTGFTSTLSWSVSNALKVTIYCEPNTASFVVGEVPAIGTREVSPGETTVYTLTAYYVDSSETESVTVEVDQNVSRVELEITTIPETPIFTYYPGSDTSKSTFTIVITETAGEVGGTFDGEISSFVDTLPYSCWDVHLLEWRTIEALGTVLYDYNLDVKCRITNLRVSLHGVDTEGRRIENSLKILFIWAN